MTANDNKNAVAPWMLERARMESTGTLRNWIWLAVNTGQPIPGCITVEAIRCVLRERGEDGSGYHNA